MRQNIPCAVRRWSLCRPTAALLLIGLPTILAQLLITLASYLALAAHSPSVAQHVYAPHVAYILLSLALLLAGTYIVERSLREQQERS